MRWLIYFFILFVAIDMLVIAYWRDSQANTSLSAIVFYLLGLPLLVGGISYFILYVYKKLKNNPGEVTENSDENNQSAQGSSLTADAKEPPVYLRVHATALQTSEGDYPEDILDSLKNHKAAQLDSTLVNAMGVHVLSRRIEMGDDEFEFIEEFADDDVLENTYPSRFKRIAVIVQRLLQTLQPQLYLLAEGMTEAAAWHTRPITEQSVLHPAWNGQHDEQVTQHTEQVIDQMQQWPAHLQIHCFLPQSWNPQDHDDIQKVIAGILQQLQFSELQFSFIPVVMDDEQNQPQLLADLLDKIQQDEKNIYLILGADSLIDQDEIDQIIWDKPDYISAEAGYGLLISHQNIKIAEFEDNCYVLINPDNKDLNIKQAENPVLMLSSLNPRLNPSQVKLLLNDLNNLELDNEHVLFAGSLLENLYHQSSGLGFVFSAALAQQGDEPYLFSLDGIQPNRYWVLGKNLGADSGFDTDIDTNPDELSG